MTGRHARLIVLSIVGLAVLITASCVPQAPRLEELIDPEIAEAQRRAREWDTVRPREP